MPAWMSASVSIASLSDSLSDAVGFGGLPDQNREYGQIVVPLDDRRLLAEAAYGMRIELPCRVGDGMGVGIDEHGPAWCRFIVFGRKSPQVEFGDRLCWKLVDVAMWVVSHVVAAEKD